MAKLSAGQRRAMPQSEYALPGKRFPINDANHARAALSMAGRGTTPAEAALVTAKARKALARKGGEPDADDKGRK